MGRPVNAKAPRLVAFEVEGAGTFPMDMLRYDRCFPADEGESGKLDGYQQRRTIELKGLDEPQMERWKSFGWTVMRVRTIKP